jgi:6-pyruvoyl-tetrahydropterin synthase
MLRIKNNMTDNFIGELFLEIQGRKKKAGFVCDFDILKIRQLFSLTQKHDHNYIACININQSNVLIYEIEL